MSHIAGSWENVHLYCDCHPNEEIEMNLQQGPHSLFYACPRYYPFNRKEGEIACYNRLNLVDCEKMLSKLAEVLMENDENGIKMDLANYTWTAKGITYKVIEYSDRRIAVKVLNKPALHGTRLS